MSEYRAFEFVVPGIPIPQGSKNPWGGEANANLKPWRATVAEFANTSLPPDHGPLVTAVEVEVSFVFPRPKAHYRTGKNAELLKDSAPYWHTGKPDLDKLQRAIGDALSGVLLRDDSQIASWMVEKRYVDLLEDEGPHARVWIQELR